MNQFPVGFLLASLLLSVPSVAAASPGTVEHIKVHAASLEGNLEGGSRKTPFQRFPMRCNIVTS